MRAPISRDAFLKLGLTATATGMIGCGGRGSLGAILPESEQRATFSVANTANTANATVTLKRMSMFRLPSRFAGFSYEKNQFNFPFFSASNQNLIGLFNRLRGSLLRIGGNAADEMLWTPTGAGMTVGQMSPVDVNNLAGFIRKTNWTVLYGINLKTSTPELAAAEAAYVAQALGKYLFAFEIGNEPNGYPNSSYTLFRTKWELFAAAIRAAVPNAVLTGPAAAFSISSYVIPFVHDEASQIVLATDHYYRGDGKSSSATISAMLSPDTKLSSMLSQLRSGVTSMPFRFSEANSYYHGGAPGVSNAFASALWVMDFLYAIAASKGAGANLHGGGSTSLYAPIPDNNGVIVGPAPEYYGMLLFSLASSGDLIPSTLSGGNNFSAYAFKPSDGTTKVICSNKDATQSVNASINIGFTPGGASAIALQAPSLSATSGLTLGGSAIGIDGSWTPSMSMTLPVSGNTVSVTIPPASALLVSAI